MEQAKQRLQSRKQIGGAHGYRRFGCLATRPRLCGDELGLEPETNPGLCIRRHHGPVMGRGAADVPSRADEACGSHRADMLLARWDQAGFRRERRRPGLADRLGRPDPCVRPGQVAAEKRGGRVAGLWRDWRAFVGREWPASRRRGRLDGGRARGVRESARPVHHEGALAQLSEGESAPSPSPSSTIHSERPKVHNCIHKTLTTSTNSMNPGLDRTIHFGLLALFFLRFFFFFFGYETLYTFSFDGQFWCG